MSHLQAYLTYGVSLLVAPPLDASVVSVLQAALAGAGGLHVGLVTFLLADSALHHDTTLGLAHAQLNILRIGPIVAGRRRRLGAGERLVNGGPERRLREQPSRHQRQVVRHPRAASGDRINAKPWSACGGGSDRWDVAETEFLQSSEQAPPNQTRVSEPGDNALFANHHLPIRFTGKFSCYHPRTREHKRGTRQLKRVSF